MRQRCIIATGKLLIPIRVLVTIELSNVYISNTDLSGQHMRLPQTKKGNEEPVYRECLAVCIY